jgi:hypothetical protein
LELSCTTLSIVAILLLSQGVRNRLVLKVNQLPVWIMDPIMIRDLLLRWWSKPQGAFGAIEWNWILDDIVDGRRFAG